MPRKKFTFAPDAASRTVECGHYDLNDGAPRCKALTHPWCLAPGESPLSCGFRAPREPDPPAPPKRKRKRNETD